MEKYKCEDCPKYRECPDKVEPNSVACIGIREHPDGAKIANASYSELAEMLKKKLKG